MKKIIIVKNTSPKFRYALVDENYQIIGNIEKISDAREYYKSSIRQGTVNITRDLSYTYDWSKNPVLAITKHRHKRNVI